MPRAGWMGRNPLELADGVVGVGEGQGHEHGEPPAGPLGGVEQLVVDRAGQPAHGGAGAEGHPGRWQRKDGDVEPARVHVGDAVVEVPHRRVRRPAPQHQVELSALRADAAAAASRAAKNDGGIQWLCTSIRTERSSIGGDYTP